MAQIFIPVLICGNCRAKYPQADECPQCHMRGALHVTDEFDVTFVPDPPDAPALPVVPTPEPPKPPKPKRKPRAKFIPEEKPDGPDNLS